MQLHVLSRSFELHEKAIDDFATRGDSQRRAKRKRGRDVLLSDTLISEKENMLSEMEINRDVSH